MITASTPRTTPSYAPPRVARVWAGILATGLVLITLATVATEPMPSHHYVAVGVGAAVTAAAWIAELAVPRWPRWLFVLAAALPHVWLTLIGHISANFLLLLLLAAWTSYAGTRRDSLLALAAGFVPLAAGVAYELAAIGRIHFTSWVSWGVALGAVWVLGRLLGRSERLLEELRGLRAAAELRAREQATLRQSARALASTLELGPLVSALLDQLKEAIDYTAASVRLLEGDELVLLAYRGPNPNPWRRARVPLADSPLNRDVVAHRETIVIGDVLADDTDLARAYRAEVGERLESELWYMRSYLGVPLTLRGAVIGVVVLNHKTAGHYTPDAVRLANAFADHAAVAVGNARLYAQAQQTASLEERQKLARELHDSVSQALYGIALGARTARTLLDRDPERAKEPVEYVLQLAEAGIAEMRALIFELRPESLAQEGLVAALQKHAASLRARYQLAVETDLGDEPDVQLSLKEALYRVAQEALHNTVKHARAAQVTLRLAARDGGVSLEVADDGAGFDPRGDFPGHLGLQSMRERVERAGGSLHLESAPGRGTRVRATLPAAPVSAAEIPVAG